jgi:hypothetical protein
MHFPRELLLLVAVAGLSACARDDAIEIPNNDVNSLVAAIRSANSTPGHQTIRLARNGLYVLSKEAEAGLLLPTVRGDLTIQGNYAEVRGYSGKPAALLQVEDGAAVWLENMALAEGTDGAVRNFGNLTLQHVAIVDSSVHQASAIVLNHGRIEASDSEIAYNLLLANSRDCGTVLNFGEIELTTTRIHDNRALGRYPTTAVAGGILNFGSVQADGLMLEDNQLPDEELPSLNFGGILNLGNGRFVGSTSADSVREGRYVAAVAGL